MFERLQAELAAAWARDYATGAAGLGPQLLELKKLSQSMHALFLHVLGFFDRAAGYDDEQTSAAGFLRAQTNESSGRCRAEEKAARLAAKLPQFAAVYARGEMSFAHVQAVLANLKLLPDELYDEVDGPLAEAARVMTAAELATFLRTLAEQLAPTPKPRDETQHESRRLSIAQGMSGMTTIHGQVTPEVGEKLRAATSAASRPDAEGEVRLPNQRTADALEHILDQVLGAGSLPVEGGEKPHLTVVVDLDQLGVPNEPVGAPGPGARGAGEKSSFAPTKEQVERAVATARAVAEATSGAPRYAWTGPASREAARRLSCDGVVLPIFTRGGEPVDVGRRTRIIPAALRALIVARDRHCRWPGCPLPVRWTEIHHLVHWRDGGPTDRTNLALLCALHHKAAHGGGFTVIVNAPGDLSVRKRLPGDPLYEVRAARGAPSDASGAVR